MSMSSARIARSPDGPLCGVCEGLGNHFGINPMFLRLGWLVAVLLFGTGLLLYLLLWWVLPRSDAVPVEPTVWLREDDGRARPPLRRTMVDRKILGVCGGIARRWGLDVSVVRLATLALFALSGGLALAFYFLAALIMPGPAAHLKGTPHPVEL